MIGQLRDKLVRCEEWGHHVFQALRDTFRGWAECGCIGARDLRETLRTPARIYWRMLKNLGVGPNRDLKTVLHDDKIGYYESIEVNGNGRVHKVAYGLSGHEVCGMKVAYSSQGCVVNKRVRDHESGRREVDLGYTRDGQLGRVWGPHIYEYEHNKNRIVLRND